MPTAIDPSKVQWDQPASAPAAALIDPAKVKWDDQPDQGLMANLATGALRGFNRAVGTLAKLAPDVPAYQKQREQFDQFNKELDQGANGSKAYKVGDVGGQVLATLPTGGVVAAPVKALATAGVAPKVLMPLAESIASSGMRAGGLTGLPGVATRAVGGAISGGASAAEVDPEHAGTGAAIGAVLPGLFGALGKVGNAIRSTIKGPAVPEAMTQAAKAAQEAGYVLPPAMVQPSLVNRVLEGTAGKLSVAQNASARNQAVTDSLAKKALGLADDVQLSPEVLDALRAEAGKAYGSVASLGKLEVGAGQLPPGVNVQRYTDALMNKRSEVDAAELVNAWRQANHDATAWYRSYGRTADPDALTKAKAARGAAEMINDFIEKRLAADGKGDLAKALQEARVQIAKTHTVEAAMNGATGTVSAPQLASQLSKGKPLSGELKQAAEFAQSFPTVAKTPEKMGALPQFSPLDVATAGATSAVMQNPMWLAGVAARPLARAAALSAPVQRGLGQAAAPQKLSAQDLEAIQLLFARSAPALAGPGNR